MRCFLLAIRSQWTSSLGCCFPGELCLPAVLRRLSVWCVLGPDGADRGHSNSSEHADPLIRQPVVLQRISSTCPSWRHGHDRSWMTKLGIYRYHIHIHIRRRRRRRRLRLRLCGAVKSRWSRGRVAMAVAVPTATVAPASRVRTTVCCSPDGPGPASLCTQSPPQYPITLSGASIDKGRGGFQQTDSTAAGTGLCSADRRGPTSDWRYV